MLEEESPIIKCARCGYKMNIIDSHEMIINRCGTLTLVKGHALCLRILQKEEEKRTSEIL